jgi:7-cyano-7-deazaguanine synthase
MCAWKGLAPKTSGLVIGRNAFLLTAALMEAPPSATTIAIGVHTGTPYADCARQFIDQMQRLFATYKAGLTIAAPFLDWRKADVFSFAHDAGVPLDLTHSCESDGPSACGSCASCRDRDSLYAGT